MVAGGEARKEAARVGRRFGDWRVRVFFGDGLSGIGGFGRMVSSATQYFGPYKTFDIVNRVRFTRIRVSTDGAVEQNQH